METTIFLSRTNPDIAMQLIECGTDIEKVGCYIFIDGEGHGPRSQPMVTVYPLDAKKPVQMIKELNLELVK